MVIKSAKWPLAPSSHELQKNKKNDSLAQWQVNFTSTILCEENSGGIASAACKHFANSVPQSKAWDRTWSFQQVSYYHSFAF